MGGLEDVYERLRSDVTFSEELAADPASALEPFGLTAHEIEALAARSELWTDDPARQRVGRAALFELLARTVDDGAVRDEEPST